MARFRDLIAFFLVAIPLLASSPALAEEDPKACAAIQNDDARLECYDLIFKKSTAAIPTASAWQVREEISKIDDSTNVFMYVDSAAPYLNRFGQPKTVTMAILCREGETNLYFVFDEFMSDSQGGGSITYRIDKQEAKTKTFSESSDHRALGLWNGAAAVGFVKKLFGAGNLLVRATPYGDSSIQVEFPVAGLEQAIAPLRKACSW